MQRQEEEFFQQIRIRPDEEAIRLIFADWLEEIGDERAEFIRVQCECARSEPSTENRELFGYEQELTKLWRDCCLEDLASLGVVDVRFVRGFIERASLKGAAFLTRTKKLAEWTPILRGVVWRKIPRISAEPIRRFFESPVFSTVTSLNLMRNNLGAAGVEALANSAGLANIQTLFLRENPIGGAGMQSLMKSPHLCGLTRWDLTETQLSPVDARSIAQANSLFQIEELELNQNHIGDAGLRAIANTARLGTLRKLMLGHNQIAYEGIRALADSPHLTDLQVLDLSLNEIGDAGLELMASASNYARLTELKLMGCGLKKAGLCALANSQYLTRLEHLDLSHNPLRNELTMLLDSRVVQSLKILNLRHCGLDTQNVRSLMSDSLMLEKLDLRENPLIPPPARDRLREKYAERVLL